MSAVPQQHAQAALGDAVKALPHFHREGVENGGYVLTTDVLRILATRQPAPDDLIGLAVSVDVSTGDDDATHRYFGKVDAVQECASEKGGIILLVQEPKPNFSAPVAAAVQGEAQVNTAVMPNGTTASNVYDAYQQGHAAGLEAAAKVCENQRFMILRPTEPFANERVAAMKSGAKSLAAAIRALNK